MTVKIEREDKSAQELRQLARRVKLDHPSHDMQVGAIPERSYLRAQS